MTSPASEERAVVSGELPPLTIEPSLLDSVEYVADIGPVCMLGQRVVLRCEDEQLATFLRAFLSSFRTTDTASTVVHLLRVDDHWTAYRDGVRALALGSVASLARSLVWYLNSLALEAPTSDVLVHASVASVDGRAVIFPGRSGAGKTTLVAALALAGWEYLSDEVAVVEPESGLVHPYPRPLALEEDSWRLVPEALTRWPSAVPQLVTDLRLLLPTSLGTGAPPGPARPLALVFPEVVGGTATQLLPLSRAEALERLIPLCFNLRALGPTGFDGLASLVRSVSCHRLVLDGVTTLRQVVEPLVVDNPYKAD